MLSKLIIKNLAIIKELEIDFTKGLNIITGETGAGKSMLIDALTLLYGGRASVEMVREGEESCEVQGLFETKYLSKDLLNSLRDNDISLDDELHIRRVVQKEGKSRAYVNGTLVSQGYLAELGEVLISILSQHEHQKLFQPEFQLDLLDRFLKNQEPLDAVSKAFFSWKEVDKKYNELLHAQSEGTKRADYLRYQINEVKEHDFADDEEEGLKSIVARADHATFVLKTLSMLKDIASSADDSAGSRLGRLIPDLSRCKEFEPGAEKILETINDAMVKLDEISEAAETISRKYDVDEEDIENSRFRLSEIKRLKKKFGCETLQEILAKQAEMEKELSLLDNIDEEIANLESSAKKLRAEYDAKAKTISDLRKKNHAKLCKKIEDILSDLGMFKGGFVVEFSEAAPAPSGTDRVEYLISTNPGEPAKGISKIASGGEMSRLMLAVQASTNQVYGYGIQVFDEVDAGIGGDVGFKVGGLLKGISDNHQVIVITHLPQIAVFADNHIKVWKEEKAGRTVVEVDNLTTENKFNEVTRMLGMENHKVAVSNVKEMLFKAQEYNSTKSI
jgi:DNA repair protein RecN (Recombination protein N)